MSAQRLTVAPGNNSDACPLCKIHRENAGFLRESCGEGYLKPGCFVVPASEEERACIRERPLRGSMALLAMPERPGRLAR